MKQLAHECGSDRPGASEDDRGALASHDNAGSVDGNEAKECGCGPRGCARAHRANSIVLQDPVQFPLTSLRVGFILEEGRRDAPAGDLVWTLGEDTWPVLGRRSEGILRGHVAIHLPDGPVGEETKEPASPPVLRAADRFGRVDAV